MTSSMGSRLGNSVRNGNTSLSSVSIHCQSAILPRKEMACSTKFRYCSINLVRVMLIHSFVVFGNNLCEQSEGTCFVFRRLDEFRFAVKSTYQEQYNIWPWESCLRRHHRESRLIIATSKSSSTFIFLTHMSVITSSTYTGPWMPTS